MPATIATGSSNAGTAAQPAIGVMTTAATSMEAARPSTPDTPSSLATRSASTM